MSAVQATKQQVNYVDVIKDIEEFYSEHSIKAYCPVAGTTLNYRPMSVKQLKRFIELQVTSGKDEYGVLPGLNAVDALNKVVVENNIGHGEGLLNSLTTVDRDAIILQLRAYTKPVAEIVTTNEETAEVNLEEVVGRIKESKIPKDLKSRGKKYKYDTGHLETKLELPTLQADKDINDQFRKKVTPKLRKGRKQVEDAVESILSEVYFLEMYKYISTITITKNKTLTTVDFRNPANFQQNLILLEKLPAPVVSDVSSYMSDVKKYRDTIFTYVNDDNREVPLDIDIALFAGI